MGHKKYVDDLEDGGKNDKIKWIIPLFKRGIGRNIF